MSTEHDLYVEGLYKKAATLDDLANINIQFLRGNIKRTLHHLGPLYPDSLPLVDDLVKLSEMGYVSIDGQSGECVYDKEYKDKEKKLYVSEKQRAYVRGLLSKKYDINKLKNFLDKDSRVIYYITELNNLDNVINNYTGYYPVTVNKIADSVRELKEKPFDYFTGLNTDHSIHEFLRVESDALEICDESYVRENMLESINYFHCVFKEWGEKHLEKYLIDVLNSITE